MTNESALSVLKDLTQHLLDAGGLYVEEVTARVVLHDPEWQEPECTRRHVALLWRDLQRSVTAEIGSALTRRMPEWNSDWQPRIVTAQLDEFEDYLDDQPTGWRPLADAHRREAGWDSAPQPESGIWVGWWEPEAAIESQGTAIVHGLLSGFIVVQDGDLRFAHVVRRRRRQGIASRLVTHAVEHHGLTGASGPFTPDGEALAISLNLR